jgi:hypothetical protein
MLGNGLDQASPTSHLSQGPKLLGATEIKELIQANVTQYSQKEHVELVIKLCNQLKQLPLLRATPVPSQIRTSPKKPPLNLSYSQVVKTTPNPRACDPGKSQVIRSPDPSCDPSTSQASCDQSARDHGKSLGDLLRDWSPTRSQDCVNFRNVTHPLINMWRTMGQINGDNAINKVTRLTAAQSAAVMLSRFDHPHTNNPPALKVSLPVTRIRACPKAVHRPPCISI